MRAPFKGIWASFAHVDEAAAVVHRLQHEGRKYSVLSPCPRHEFYDAMGRPQSRLPWITLVFGGLGIFFGYGFPSWTALDWVLPVSQKPIVGIPAFTIIAFELMVLLGGISTALASVLFGHLELFRQRLPASSRFKGYGRFSNDRFGIVVSCEEGEATSMETLMREHSAEEVVREF
jgi:molybdopterin-containing oxidoreductase family membrane subunit